MPSPILARADALMQRRRAGAEAETDGVPVLTDAIAAPPAQPAPAAGDGIPLLLNIESAAPPPKDRPPPSPSPAADPEAIARDLARRIERRLAAELPRLAAAAVREYLAEHGAGLAPPGQKQI